MSKEEKLELPIFDKHQVEGIGLIKHISQYSTQELNCLLARHKDFYRDYQQELEVCSQIIKAIDNELRERGTEVVR